MAGGLRIHPGPYYWASTLGASTLHAAAHLIVTTALSQLHWVASSALIVHLQAASQGHKVTAPSFMAKTFIAVRAASHFEHLPALRSTTGAREHAVASFAAGALGRALGRVLVGRALSAVGPCRCRCHRQYGDQNKCFLHEIPPLTSPRLHWNQQHADLV